MKERIDKLDFIETIMSALQNTTSRELEDRPQTGRKHLPCQSQHHQENINRGKKKRKKSKNSVLLVCDAVK